MARTVADAALLLNAIAGLDPRRPPSSACRCPTTRALAGPPEGAAHRRAATASSSTTWTPRSGGDPRCAVRLRDSRRRGRVSLPLVGGGVGPRSRRSCCRRRRLPRGAGSRAADTWRGRPRPAGAGRAVPRRHYLQAQRLRTLMSEEWRLRWSTLRPAVVPTTPVAARRSTTTTSRRTLTLRASPAPFNLTGLPAVSVPCGFPGGLPIGMQLVGRPCEEATVLRIANAYEQATDWHTRTRSSREGAAMVSCCRHGTPHSVHDSQRRSEDRLLDAGTRRYAAY